MAHFEPEVIAVTGEGIFPQVSFDIPREMSRLDSESFAPLREKAMANLHTSLDEQVQYTYMYMCVHVCTHVHVYVYKYACTCIEISLICNLMYI